MDDTAVKLITSCFKPHIVSAYEQCDPIVQLAVDRMVDVLADTSLESIEEKRRAAHTILDALFPSMAQDIFDSARKSEYSRAGRKKEQQMAQEESVFADNLQRIMDEKGLTQEKLAIKTGLTQPAISNMLIRKSRPQRKTVIRFAEALDVKPEVLWPGYVSSPSPL